MITFKVMWREEPPQNRTEDLILREELPIIPFSLIEEHALQCRKNHSQTPQRLNQRGGLCLSELAAVLSDRRWKSMTEKEALKEVNTFLI